MIVRLWGKKIGMTQYFSTDDQSKLIPVTAVSIGSWRILQRKTVAHDGYDALQIGFLRSKYANQPFCLDWLKNKKQYFMMIKEISYVSGQDVVIGDELAYDSFFTVGQELSVCGKTIGKGFQGCVKRYGFTGGRGSHGDKLGRKPGSLSGLRTQGRVFKGKKMPGHMGDQVKTISGLKIVQYFPQEKVVLISGPVPGKSGSFLFLSKSGSKK
jgi:large subunit ribosomal protein L3